MFRRTYDRPVPDKWWEQHGEWHQVPLRALGRWPSNQPLPDIDIENLKKEGIHFESKLGSGSWGEVWKTRMDGSGTYLAAKICSLKTSMIYGKTVREGVELMLREMEITRALSHPHIVSVEHILRVYDELENNFPLPLHVLCFMELMDGDLRDMIRDMNEIPEPLCLKWFVQIANALKYLHEESIAHLDIKPDNILFVEHPTKPAHIVTKLTDFGLSERFVGMRPAMTDRKPGTKDFMAPEFQTAYLTDPFKADIYSLGMTLIECLCGEDYDNPPLMAQIMTNIQKYIPVRYTTAVQELIRAMTNPNPMRRMDINQVCAHRWTTSVPYIPGKHFFAM